MEHKFDIGKMLLSALGYKGLPYPGAFLGMLKPKNGTNGTYEMNDQSPEFKEFTDKGTRLYKKDYLGLWYFMPVTFTTESGEIEISHAVINVTGKKTIVETQMIGRKGGVKELINVDDYRVSIGGYIQSPDGTYPEDRITNMKELFNVNRAVELKSALTDLLFDENDKVVITDMGFPSTPGMEDAQIIKIECVTDKPFELIVK